MFIKSKILKSPHAFSTRLGGVSAQEHTKELNLAFGRGDEDETVFKNLEIFAHAVGFDPKSIVSVPQIHSDKILNVEKSDCGKGFFIRDGIDGADGYITDKSGITLGVKTADCVPILFEAEVDGSIVAVGAVHAGWRGTLAGIAPKCAKLLCDSFGASPDHIRAAIGPSIRKCCYEVGVELFDAAQEGIGESLIRKYITPKIDSAQKFWCDLVGINRELLIKAGLLCENIDVVEECTCCHPEKFYSHRYSNGVRGTMLNVIFVQD